MSIIHITWIHKNRISLKYTIIINTIFRSEDICDKNEICTSFSANFRQMNIVVTYVYIHYNKESLYSLYKTTAAISLLIFNFINYIFIIKIKGIVLRAFYNS